MSNKESYDKAANTYDQGRPPYPEEVISWIIETAKISHTDQLLEIAPGTGQATLEFGKRGFRIKCVELGKNLAELLTEKVKGMDVSVDVAPFEDWINTTGTQYNHIYCATAFHWLDPGIKYKKCSELLTDDGKLILIWNVVSGTKSKIINQAYDMLWEHYPDKRHIDSSVLKERRKHEIAKSGEFRLVEYLDFKWNPSSQKEQIIQGFYSQSSYLSLDEEKRKDLKKQLDTLFEDLEPVIYSDVSTTVYICEKIHQTNSV